MQGMQASVAQAQAAIPVLAASILGEGDQQSCDGHIPGSGALLPIPDIGRQVLATSREDQVPDKVDPQHSQNLTNAGP